MFMSTNWKVIMKNFATCVLGAGLAVFGIGLIAVSVTVSKGIDDARYIVAQAPVVLEQAKSFRVEMEASVEKVERMTARAREALPEAGNSLGEAGASALTSFSKRLSGDKKAADETKALDGAIEDTASK